MNKAYPNMNFVLLVEGRETACRSVRAFEHETEYETIQEGGVNDYVHIRRKPSSKPVTFQMERYRTAGEDGSEELFNVGTALKQDMVLMVSSVQGDFKNPVAQFTFSGCIVTGKHYSELEAEKSGLLTETVTIICERLTVIRP